MTTIRAQLAAAISPNFPAGVIVIDHPRDITTLDPDARAMVMIVRTEFKRAPDNPQGELLHDFEVWLIEPVAAEDGTGEDRLDEIADTLAETLTRAAWIVWGGATRTVFKDKWPAYRFTATITSKPTTSEPDPAAPNEE